MKYTLKNENIESYNESDTFSFPKYTSQLINWANQNAQGTRPVVVVQNDYGNRFAPTLIVVPLTTEIKKADMPTHYVLRHQRGLDKPCMALAEQIQTIRKSQIIRYLGHVRPIHMSCIDLGIRESIGLPPQHIIRIIPPNEQKE